jgi:hypothetical protein
MTILSQGSFDKSDINLRHNEFFGCWYLAVFTYKNEKMTADNKPKHETPNTALPVVSTLLAFSGAWWFAYAVPLRRKEWVDILLDYSHHKRTRYSPGLLDRGASYFCRLLKIR